MLVCSPCAARLHLAEHDCTTCSAPACPYSVPPRSAEWCAKGSLFDVLRSAARHPERAAVLTVGLRLQMAVDAARGLLYLHRHVPAIVHRDVKVGRPVIVKEMAGRWEWLPWLVSAAALSLGALPCLHPWAQSPNLLVDEHYRVKVAGEWPPTRCRRGRPPAEHACLLPLLLPPLLLPPLLLPAVSSASSVLSCRASFPATRLQPVAPAGGQPGRRRQPGRPNQPHLVRLDGQLAGWLLRSAVPTLPPCFAGTAGLLQRKVHPQCRHSACSTPWLQDGARADGREGGHFQV